MAPLPCRSVSQRQENILYYFIFTYNTHPIKLLTLYWPSLLQITKISPHLHLHHKYPKATEFFTSKSILISFHPLLPHQNHDPISKGRTCISHDFSPCLKTRQWLIVLRIEKKLLSLNDRVLSTIVPDNRPNSSPFVSCSTYIIFPTLKFIL